MPYPRYQKIIDDLEKKLVVLNFDTNQYLGHYIKLCVYLSVRLGASEPCPFKKRHTEINGSGIKNIVLPVEFKLLVDTLFLGKFYHMIGKLFKITVFKRH